jgi:hypothetical protein
MKYVPALLTVNELPPPVRVMDVMSLGVVEVLNVTVVKAGAPVVVID